MPKTYKAGQTIQLKQGQKSTDSNKLGYPWVYIPAGSIGTLATGVAMPFVNQPGYFYKAWFGNHCVAVTPLNIKPVAAIADPFLDATPCWAA